jgi:hypothetical protein
LSAHPIVKVMRIETRRESVQVLVATNESQGDDKADYSFTVEGELVTPATLEFEGPDERVCERGFSGLASSRATTTAVVMSRPQISRDMLRQAVFDSLERRGWFIKDLAHEFDLLVDYHVGSIVEVSRAFGLGTIVRRRANGYWATINRDAA